MRGDDSSVFGIKNVARYVTPKDLVLDMQSLFAFLKA